MSQGIEKEAKSFKSTTGTMEITKIIGNQAVLQRMGVVQMGQDHHVIPRQLKDFCDNKYSAGYSLFENLTVSLEYHIGSHPNYTAAVETALSYIDDDAQAVEFAKNLGKYLEGFGGLDMNEFEFADIQHLIPREPSAKKIKWINPAWEG